MLKIKIRARYCLYSLVGLVALLGIAYDFYDIFHASGQTWQVTTFPGAVLVATGWIVTNELALRNSRRQHTINLVTTLMTNERRIQDKEKIRSKLPRGKHLNRTILDYDNENDLLAQAIDRELNFYEFLAIGIFNADLDERMAKRMLRGLVVGFVEQVEDYILYWQSKDRETWADVYALHKKWQQD